MEEYGISFNEFSSAHYSHVNDKEITKILEKTGGTLLPTEQLATQCVKKFYAPGCVAVKTLLILTGDTITRF